MATREPLPVEPKADEQIHWRPAHQEFKTYEVLGVPIAAVSMPKAIAVLTTWLHMSTTTRVVTFTNVHMLVEGLRSPSFLQFLRHTDMNCPDGMPLVWFGRHNRQPVSRVCGPEFMPAFCRATARMGYRHFFYGGHPGVAERVVSNLKRVNPRLQVAGFFSPPFGPMDASEDDRVVESINRSGADVVWVCLGCPKQEIWMAEHRDRLNARLLLAVGMAFDVAAGRKERAPLFVRTMGMEWLFRMLCEPRRLAWRYLRTNSLFLYAALRAAFLRHLSSANILRQRQRVDG